MGSKTKPATSDEYSLSETLHERGGRYGRFEFQAEYAQDIKAVIHRSPNWEIMAPDQREALDMVANKVARILNGDPHYRDSWHDMVGYLALVDERMELDGL